MREVVTLKTGKTVTVLTGRDGDLAVLHAARECAALGGKAAAETVKVLEAELGGEYGRNVGRAE